MLTTNTSTLQPNGILETGMAAINASYDSNTAKVLDLVTGNKVGHISRNGSYWKAIGVAGTKFSKGDTVHVIGKIRDKLMLLIGPLENGCV